jgi:Tol biopolymer transport system component
LGLKYLKIWINQYAGKINSLEVKMRLKNVLIIILLISFITILSGCVKSGVPDKTTETTGEVTETTELTSTTLQTEETPETSGQASLTDTGRIIFSSLDNDTGTIYICNPAGSNLEKLIEGGINTSPSWNKDHSKIVFNSIDPSSGAGGLYIYDMASKSKTLLYKGLSPMEASFSPDGSTLIFIDFPEENTENFEIYTINLNGSNLTRLTDNSARDYFPGYSPDGKIIVFSSERDGNIQLYTMDNSGQNVKRLMENSFTDNVGSFSPDGLNIIFNSDRGGSSDIYKINSNGSGEATNLTNNSAGNYEASYSPDGSMIVYRSNRGLPDDMSYDIFVMSSDGSNQTDITKILNKTNEFDPSW